MRTIGDGGAESVRLDRWLWAARFYKTRGPAHDACEGGKVDVNGQAAKPSRAVRVGDRLRVTLGEWRRELVIRVFYELLSVNDGSVDIQPPV